jgi:hypothetical protein
MFMQMRLLTGEWPFDAFEEPIKQRGSAVIIHMILFSLFLYYFSINIFIAIISRAFAETQVKN